MEGRREGGRKGGREGGREGGGGGGGEGGRQGRREGGRENSDIQKVVCPQEMLQLASIALLKIHNSSAFSDRTVQPTTIQTTRLL